MQLTCIYCEIETFDQGKGSEEHVILSSIGGRKTSRSICCVSCNNRLGDEIDRPLTEGLKGLSNYIGVVTGRGKDSATLKNHDVYDGIMYDLTHGGRLQRSKIELSREIDEDNGLANISIVARNTTELNKLFNQQIESFGESIKSIQVKEITEIIEYPNSLTLDIDIGLVSHYRSIAKSALTYIGTVIAPERLRNGLFLKLIEYIKGENDELGLVAITKVTFPSMPNIFTMQHRIIISASSKKRMAIGLVELFGGITFKVVLSDCWDGPNLQKGYAIDPISGEHDECMSNLNLNDDHWLDQPSDLTDQNYIDMMSKVMKNAIAQHTNLEHQKLISETVSEFCQEFANRDLDDHLCMILSNRLTKALTDSIFKIKKKRNIELSELTNQK